MPGTKPTRKKRKGTTATVPALNPIETAFAHLVIRGKSAPDAAEELGLAREDGPRYYARKAVQQYLAEYRSVFLQQMAAYEARELVKRKITRETVAARYMELADMPPEMTKGSIDGQVEALKAVSELLGMKFDPAKIPGLLSGMTDEQLREAATQGPTQ
jgi:hypothetical protein